MKNNKDEVLLTQDEALKMFVEINYIAVSLANIDRYYSLPENNNNSNYQYEIGKFILDQRVTKKLLSVRAILTNSFDLTIGNDDMDALERACQNIDYWEPYAK